MMNLKQGDTDDASKQMSVIQVLAIFVLKHQRTILGVVEAKEHSPFSVENQPRLGLIARQRRHALDMQAQLICCPQRES